VRPSELVECALARTHAVNPDINAVIVSLSARARKQASAFEAMEGGAPGPLYGLPVLVKECHAVQGELCTLGAPPYAGVRAPSSHPVVAAIEASGGVVIGITNQPEHAAGSHTFNPLFGTTSNPHEPSCTAGGSSGGSAAALAVGCGWLASGTDLGGSLRNPAAFCGVVGLRTCPGRCAMPSPKRTEWRGRWGVGLHAVSGPLARSVADLALLLDAMAPAQGRRGGGGGGGPEGRGGVGSGVENPEAADGWEPHSIPTLPPVPSKGYLAHVRSASEHPPKAVAWSVNLGGLLRGVHPEVGLAVERAAGLLAEACGALAERASPPDLAGAHEVFLTLRHSRMLDGVAGGPSVAAEWLKAHERQTKPEVVWELKRALEGGWQRRVAEAEHARQGIEASFVRFLDAFDILICPCALMPPFDKRMRYPSQCTLPPELVARWEAAGGRDTATGAASGASPAWVMRDYTEWMLPCSVVSLTNLPAVSVPMGFTAAGGLPIGVQLVGRAGGEADLLAAAALLERAVLEEGLHSGCEGSAGDADVPPIQPKGGNGADGHTGGVPTCEAKGAGRQAYLWSGPSTESAARKHLSRYEH
jgi:amidase